MANEPTTVSVPMFCRRCGYSLLGLPCHRCPECGRNFDPANCRTLLNRKPRPTFRRFAKIMTVSLCLAMPFGIYFGCLALRVYQESLAVKNLEKGHFRCSFYDARPDWAKIVLCGHGAWFWKRVEKVDGSSAASSPDGSGPPDVEPYALACSIVRAFASRSSLTQRSCSVPHRRSIRPLANIK